MNRILLSGMILFFFLLCITFIGPSFPFVSLEPEEPYRISESGTITTAPFPPSVQNILGSDADGRDMLSLLIVGTKHTLLFILIVTLVRYIIAVPLALAAAKEKGFAHYLLHGWNHIVSGLPILFAMILLMHIPFFYDSPYRTVWFILIIALLEVGRVGHVFQQYAKDLSKSLFVEAGRAVGNHEWGLFLRYYLPYLLPQIVVSFVIDLGRVLLVLGQLAFFSIFISQAWVYIDMGIWELRNTSVDWLSMIAENRHEIRSNAWILLAPALAIVYTILTFNLVGEGLRQYFESVSKRHDS